MPPSRNALALCLVATSAFAETPPPPPPPVTPPVTPSVSAPAPAPEPVPPVGAGRDAWLKTRIDDILSRANLGPAQIGVAVAEVESGRVLYAKNDGALYNPASNAKLVTTAAALALLGPEFRWKTVLGADAVHAGVVEGNLYLRGFGDPSLVSEDLWKMVSDLAAAGVKRVSGNIVVDDSYFDDVRVGPGFEQKDEDYAFRAPNGAVSLNYNAVSILVLPGATDGAPARVVVEPSSPYFVVTSTARTAKHGKPDLQIDTAEAPGHTDVKVAGTVRIGEGGHAEHRRVAHPDLYAGYSLRELLVRRGIKVGGTVVTGAAPPNARTLVTHWSSPLGVLVRDVNKHSNNFMAEQLLKTLGAELGGRPGTWPKGVDAVGKFLAGLGIPAAKYKMINGSGLYDADRFTPSQFIAVLRAVYRDFRYASDFVGSLPLAGADGTIGHRLEGSPAERFVRAKTGTLVGVSCLSGYAGAPGHFPLAFSILMNGLKDDDTPSARKAQDAIAETLVDYLEAP